MKKPRPIIRDGKIFARVWNTPGHQRSISIRDTYGGRARLLYLDEARRLRAWLDKAIEYLEEREGRG